VSNIKLVHSGGNSVTIAAPDSNPAANRTLKLPSNADGNILTSTSGSPLQVLEEFGSPCDGSSFTTSNGTVTFQNVTSGQNNTSSSYIDMTGSSISYQPPSGTVQVHYYFSYVVGYLDNPNGYQLGHYQNVIDGNVVTKSKHTYRADDYQGMQHIHWIFNIGGSTDYTVGRVANWNSAKTLKVQMREYSGSYNLKVHENNYMDGGGPGSYLTLPTLYIKSIGVPS
tara:strand:+ start:483 stop:1157 length:675 start_codon:yes stop_codon:yes gene_type:complete